MTDDAMKHVKAFTSLQNLNLSNGSFVSGKGLQEIRDLRTLQVLKLDWCRDIDDESLDVIVGLDRLHTLHLSATAVSDKGVEKLKNLKSLRKLDVSYTKMTEQGVDRLKKELPTCEITHEQE